MLIATRGTKINPKNVPLNKVLTADIMFTSLCLNEFGSYVEDASPTILLILKYFELEIFLHLILLQH